MPNPQPALDQRFTDFIERQQMFFVATAAEDGRVNVSPKGLDSLRILAPDRIVWLNLTGSGNETSAHLQVKNRITLMFCAFEGAPMILRVYGSARLLHPRDDGWSELLGLFPVMAGSRQIFDIAIDRVEPSCGSGVPLYAYKGQRGKTQLVPFYDKMGEEKVRQYWDTKNKVNIDGLATGI
ncbi:MAG: pyridoxamine 5'-phosphate oxidase family protein [Rhodospirillales bacterium]|nr:pyridoxamine 5'-phosphate oxidase family protein [Rhodospirillales bacterium]